MAPRKPNPSPRAVSFRYVSVVAFATLCGLVGIGPLVFVFARVDLSNPAATGLVGPAIAGVVTLMALAAKRFFDSETSTEDLDSENKNDGVTK